MKDQALIFFPNEVNPRLGWQDFHTVLGWYRLLDDSLQHRLGPYYFLFQMPD